MFASVYIEAVSYFVSSDAGKKTQDRLACYRVNEIKVHDDVTRQVQDQVVN